MSQSPYQRGKIRLEWCGKLEPVQLQRVSIPLSAGHNPMPALKSSTPQGSRLNPLISGAKSDLLWGLVLLILVTSQSPYQRGKIRQFPVGSCHIGEKCLNPLVSGAKSDYKHAGSSLLPARLNPLISGAKSDSMLNVDLGIDGKSQSPYQRSKIRLEGGNRIPFSVRSLNPLISGAKSDTEYVPYLGWVIVSQSPYQRGKIRLCSIRRSFQGKRSQSPYQRGKIRLLRAKETPGGIVVSIPLSAGQNPTRVLERDHKTERGSQSPYQRGKIRLASDSEGPMDEACLNPLISGAKSDSTLW